MLDVVEQKYRQVYQIGLNRTFAPEDRTHFFEGDN